MSSQKEFFVPLQLIKCKNSIEEIYKETNTTVFHTKKKASSQMRFKNLKKKKY